MKGLFKIGTVLIGGYALLNMYLHLMNEVQTLMNQFSNALKF